MSCVFLDISANRLTVERTGILKCPSNDNACPYSEFERYYNFATMFDFVVAACDNEATNNLVLYGMESVADIEVKVSSNPAYSLVNDPEDLETEKDLYAIAV